MILLLLGGTIFNGNTFNRTRETYRVATGSFAPAGGKVVKQANGRTAITNKAIFAITGNTPDFSDIDATIAALLRGIALT